MLSFLLSVVVLALLKQCLVGAASVPRSAPLAVRQWLENVSGNMNTTTSAATILDVYISEDKQSYYTLITMGNMSFRIALDTGSADLYQLGYKSSTFESVNDNQTLFNVSYADTTTASGFVARETVLLNNLTVVNQAFGLINSSNVSLANDISGVMGLSFSRLSTISDTVVNATSIFGSMAQQGQLDYPLFGLSLKTNATGTLALGAIDATTVTNRSRIEWYEVVPFAPYNGTNGTTASYLQWVIELSNITVNGTNVTPQPTYSQSASNHSLALFDVGASGIYGPYQDVARIFDQISGARLVDASSGQWVVPCDLSETISFNFGESNFTLQPTDYLVGPVSDDPYYCLAWPAATSPSDDGIDWQLGTPFLQTVYSIYSFGIDTKEAPMIGLYALHNATELDESVADVSSYFFSASATVDTTLPNYLVSTPVYTTPAYIFNTSVSAPPGLIVSSGLATSTYSPVLGTATTVNASAIPTVDPSPTLFTYIVTVSSGVVSTSVSTVSQATVTLGEPPGWSSGAATVHVPTRFVVLALSALLLVVAF